MWSRRRYASDVADGDFHLGAEVRSSDGRVIGKLVHLLVGPDYALRALVVKESSTFSGHRFAPASFLVNDEFVVPKEAARSLTRDRIDLTLSAVDARRLPPYLSYRQRDETATEVLADLSGPLTASPEAPHWIEQVANKPADELEIDGGENVMLGHSGRKLGTVKDVLFDEEQLVGIVLRPEGFFREEVILPRRFLDRSDDAALFAKIDDTDLEQLKPFRP